MDTQFLDRFKDYVRHNYNNCDLTSFVICANIHCSRGYMYEILDREYNYPCMKYVKYIRILKSMEFISNGIKKFYHNVGYKSSSVFSKAFLKITGFSASCFYADELANYKGIIPVVRDIATKNPKEAIEFVINHSSIRPILLDKRGQKFNVNLS